MGIESVQIFEQKHSIVYPNYSFGIPFRFVALEANLRSHHCPRKLQHNVQAPMVTAAADNDSVLSAYVQDSASVSPAHVASAIQSVIISVAARKSVSKSTIKTAQNVLASLFQSPHPDIIPRLLLVCDGGVPYDNVDHFVLCTAAWKALSAAVIQEFSSNQMPASTLLKMIASATQAAFSMVLRVVSMVQALASSGGSSVARWVKVAKFFALHATRGAQVLSRTNDGASVMIDEGTKKLFADACGHAIRLLGLLAFACFSSDHEFRAIRDDLITGLSPLVTSLTRSLLTTLCFTIDQDSPKFALSVLDTTHKSFSNPSIFVVDKYPPCSPELLHLFATLQLMRYAASEPSKLTNETNGKTDRDFRALRHIFRRSLCAALFSTLDTCYDKIVTLRERTSQTPFIVVIASVAAECFTAVDLNEVKGIETSITSLQDALFVEMSSVNPARALVAVEGLCQILRVLLAKRKPEQSHRCVGLLVGVMKCSQMALTLRSAHAESRWIPLAARMGHLCINEEGMLLRAFNESCKQTASNLNKHAFHDPFLLRLIYKLCHNSPLSTDIGTKNDASCALSLSRILKCFNLDMGQFKHFVVDILNKKCIDDDLVQCALALVPYVMDRMHGSSVVVGCIRQGGLSAAAFCVGMHTLQPANIDTGSLSGLVKDARSYVDRCGVVVCAAVSAFVSRGVSHAGIVERPAMLSELLGLLRMSVEKVATTGGDERDAAAITALSGAVYYHAAIALSSVTSTVTRNRVDVNSVVGENVLMVIEKSQERHMELKNRAGAQGDDDWATVLREKDHIAAETNACRRGGTRLQKKSTHGGNVVAVSRLETIQGVRESLAGLLGEMVTAVASEGDNSANWRTSLIAELNELRRTVNFIEDWCDKEK